MEKVNLLEKLIYLVKRTIKAKKKENLTGRYSDEALILSIQDKAKVDLNYMQKLCGIDTDKMIKKS